VPSPAAPAGLLLQGPHRQPGFSCQSGQVGLQPNPTARLAAVWLATVQFLPHLTTVQHELQEQLVHIRQHVCSIKKGHEGTMPAHQPASPTEQLLPSESSQGNLQKPRHPIPARLHSSSNQPAVMQPNHHTPFARYTLEPTPCWCTPDCSAHHLQAGKLPTAPTFPILQLHLLLLLPVRLPPPPLLLLSCALDTA
jgi:hypothetical protein